MTVTISRFSLTALILFATAIMNAIVIQTKDHSDVYDRLVVSFVIGVFFSVAFQMFYERFFEEKMARSIFMAVTFLVMLLYFFYLKYSEWDTEFLVKTAALLFLLLITFLWIPSIKSGLYFHQTFMAAFKAFFITLFYAVVIFLGVSLILFAINQLIVNVDDTAYEHVANLIFVLFAPIYFLSFIPVYPKEDNIDHMDQMSAARKFGKVSVKEGISAPKFLTHVISYVFIPVTAVFTVILLIYIIANITGDFWTDNLLEPMLVTYSITVIIVYLLACQLENKIAYYFKLIFPKVLIPIVLFQTISSIIRIGEMGITYGRYYVILFGVFATIAGIIFSFFSVRKIVILRPF